MPTLTVVGGPNGSGKSSVICAQEFEGLESLLNPDIVAKRINPEDPQRAAVAAAREVILKTREYLDNRQSFAIETTLSSGSTLATMGQAKALGFVVRLLYVCLDTAELNIQRVRERVVQGGHDVPESDIRRRYHRSLSNLPAAPRLAHEGFVFDNSDLTRKVLETRSGAIVWRADNEPAWVTRICEAISSPDTFASDQPPS